MMMHSPVQFCIYLQTPPCLTVAPDCSQVLYLFIDFTLLLPENLGKLPKSVPTQAHLFHMLRSELTPLNEFRDWTQAWAVFAGVLAKKVPQMPPDVIAYFLLLAKTVKENPSANWFSYDKLFREKAALEKSLVWGAADPSLWVTHMLSRSIEFPLTQAPTEKSVVSLIRSDVILATVNFYMPVRIAKAFTILLWSALTSLNRRTEYLIPRLKKSKDRSGEKEADIPLKNVESDYLWFLLCLLAIIYLVRNPVC